MNSLPIFAASCSACGTFLGGTRSSDCIRTAGATRSSHRVIMKMPLVASLYTMGAALMSVCCKYHLVHGIRRVKMGMSYRAVMRGKEYWRLGTSIFLFDVENPLDIYTLVALFMSLSLLEQRFFKGSALGMLTSLIFMDSMLLVPGFYMRELRVKEPSMMMFVAIVTWATIRCSIRPSSGVSSLTSALGPLVPLVIPHIRTGAVDMTLLRNQGLAIAVGLACVLLIPDNERERTVRRQRQRAANKKIGGVGETGSGGTTGNKAAASAEDSSSSSSSSSEGEEEEEVEQDGSEVSSDEE